ncbi:hypothetical protein ATO12_00320 [Aquimarina atlantica]|uniref:Uncharacterized protein n=1 Tax=Aquimarina atlantica TaxID=1317122 RepID=A0A023BZ38_9FLAO|nr:DUF5367 family protein [Aquimarina atlantica]EZH75255.1 hypothetical protein ATO12_00320 [Aquimarina atlantica]
MISKKLFSIICAIVVWILGISFYLLSHSVPILENPERQSNIVLVLVIIPSAWLGTYVFYKYNYMKPSSLALTFVLVAITLDVLVTVPVFVIPNGGSYSDFFGNPMFYTIVVEFYFTVLYFGNHLTKKIET